MTSLASLHNVTVTGDGETTLLLSHGFGCGQSAFRFLVKDLARDYRVVTYDLAGAGGYPVGQFDRRRYQTLNGYARDVIAICDELGLRDVVHVGHSVSAMIAGLAAIERPGLFARLVMIGPSPRYINEGDYFGGFTATDIEELVEVMGENYTGWSNQMAPAIMGNAERPELGRELTTSFCAQNPEIAKFFARVTFTSDNRADLPNITTPTLVLQCQDDIIAPEIVGRYVHDHLPHSTFVLMDARGHLPNVSAPAETIRLIRRFLADVSEPAARV